MLVNPFVAGIFVTLSLEAFALIIIAIINNFGGR